jgi:hypothetical protein
MRCPKCNLEIPDGAKFCPCCGVYISKYLEENKISEPKDEQEEKYNYYIKSLGIDKILIDRDRKVGSNEYLPYNKFIEYKAKESSFSGFIGIAIVILSIDIPFIYFSVAGGYGLPVLAIVIFLITITFTWIFCSSELEKHNESINALKGLQCRVDEHNENFMATTLTKLLDENGVKHVDKEIMLTKTMGHVHKIVIDEVSSIFLLLDLNCDCSNPIITTQKALFSEILRYNFLDNSTQTQSSISKTSSNSGKALGGAVVSKLLINDATAGAVIGGSGERVTKTKSKTTINPNYQLTIYLNRLDNSVITINTTSGDIMNEIIATLEYILNKNS